LTTSHSDAETSGEQVPPDVVREAKELRLELDRHGRLYYVEARPEITDLEYDELFRRLVDLEARFPDLVTLDSPTQRVGAEPQDKFETIAHVAPMLSLDSTQELDEVRRFHDRVRKALGGGIEPSYLLEPKLDGASIELVYEDGVLSRAVTRGNGQEGERVTENIRTISSVPLRLRTDICPAPTMLAIRGEVIMNISNFRDLNAGLIENGAEPYASPRNSAAGAIRQLDPSVTASRKLDVLAYDVLAVEGHSVTTDSAGVDALRDWGLKVPERVELARSVQDIASYHQHFVTERDHMDYEIDGVVIKLDDLSARRAMGSTSHHPRWALAFKFLPRQETTRIDKIDIQVGRTGVLTPVAFLSPVVVGGVTVARASLHNREELKRKDLREGDRVRIQRAGDVIPQVVEVLGSSENRSPPFNMPTECPVCGASVYEEGPRTICPNQFGCRAQLKGRIAHFAAREALDIEGLGEETAHVLVETGLISGLAQLFDLTPEELMQLDGFAEKSATGLVTAIQAKKTPELRRFLVALGIPEVGVNVARRLAAHFGDFSLIRSARREDLEAIPGVGSLMSKAITSFFSEDRNASTLDALLERGVKAEITEPADTALPDIGTVVFTGMIPVPRVVAESAWREIGGSTKVSVSKKTTFVVVGENAGSKLKKAERLGVQVLNFDQFVERLRDLGGDIKV